MNKNGLNLGQVVFSAVKVVLMVLFLIFEGVPTFIDRLSDGRSIIFAIIELVGSTASIYVVVTILVMVFLMTCSLLGTFIAFVLLVFLMSLCTATVAAMILNLVFVVLFIILALHDIENIFINSKYL